MAWSLRRGAGGGSTDRGTTAGLAGWRGGSVGVPAVEAAIGGPTAGGAGLAADGPTESGRTMKDAVSQVIVERAVGADGAFWRMLALSTLAHAGVLSLLVLLPGALGGSRAEELQPVMTISLGGAPGPRAGGMTPLGGRPVQQAVTEPPRREPVRPPAAREPEMTVPVKEARRAPRAAAVPQAPAEARGAQPTRGPREQLGSAVADTGGSGIGFGLSTGGGGTGGEINLGDFCCPEYLSTLLQVIQRNWNPKQGVAGTVAVKFTIQRDGRITGVEVARSSGYAILDLAAQRAVALSTLPPLPPGYTNPTLTIHLNFQYQR
jgi:protein TonB